MMPSPWSMHCVHKVAMPQLQHVCSRAVKARHDMVSFLFFFASCADCRSCRLLGLSECELHALMLASQDALLLHLASAPCPLSGQQRTSHTRKHRTCKTHSLQQQHLKSAVGCIYK